MSKATVTLVSLFGSVGVFVGVVSLSQTPTGAVLRTPSPEVVELRPPPLEPASAPEINGALLEGPSVVITIDEVPVPRQRRKATPHPAALPERELHPCSEWEDVGPRSLQEPGGPVAMQRARLLC